MYRIVILFVILLVWQFAKSRHECFAVFPPTDAEMPHDNSVTYAQHARG